MIKMSIRNRTLRQCNEKEQPQKVQIQHNQHQQRKTISKKYIKAVVTRLKEEEYEISTSVGNNNSISTTTSNFSGVLIIHRLFLIVFISNIALWIAMICENFLFDPSVEAGAPTAALSWLQFKPDFKSSEDYILKANTKQYLIRDTNKDEEERKHNIKYRNPEQNTNFSASLMQPTDLLFHNQDRTAFYGRFASIRSSLDYSYHANYIESRQELQDSILSSFLNDNTVVIDGNTAANCSSPSSTPWVVFTAGVMGAGKSYTIKQLHQKQYFPLQSFLTVDPDEIRRHLPEYNIYNQICPEQAGEYTRKESGYISEILIHAALKQGKNVLIDGSLRDAKWYQQYFASLRHQYKIQIAILHVTASEEQIFKRVHKRSLDTGRVVPNHTILNALEQVPRSIHILSPLADFFAEINNDADHDISLINENMDWNSFKDNWQQSCLII